MRVLAGGWVGSRRNFACKAVGQSNRTQSLAFKVKIAMLDPSGGMERADQGKPALLAVTSPSPQATATSGGRASAASDLMCPSAVFTLYTATVPK